MYVTGTLFSPKKYSQPQRVYEKLMYQAGIAYSPTAIYNKSSRSVFSVGE